MLALYHAHEYGDFKGTIQGLLAAYSYESSILQVPLSPLAQLTSPCLSSFVHIRRPWNHAISHVHSILILSWLIARHTTHSQASGR